MLSIILSASAAVISFLCLKKNAGKWPMLTFFVFFNWFIIEAGVYIYLLAVVHSGNFLFLIGNQGVLDRLMKQDITRHVFTQKNEHNAFYQVDPELGYTLGKNKNFWLYSSNGQGIRAQGEYSLKPSPAMLRLALFGDSFVFCDGEPYEGSWPYMLQQNVKGLEVINFGVSGYGLSSSYLRYLKEGRLFHPDIIFINYILLGDRDWLEGSLMGGTELRRSTLYRPLLALKDGKLGVRPFSPLDLFNKNLRDEYLYRPMGLDHSILFSWGTPFFSWTNTGLALKNLYLQKKFNSMLAAQASDPQIQQKRLGFNEKLLEDFLDQAQQQNATVIFFYERDFGDLPPPIQAILIEHAEHVLYINGTKLLKTIFDKLNLQPSDYLNNTNHYNAMGNQVYAQVVAQILETNHWKGAAGRSFKFCAKTNSFQNTSLEPCP